MQLLRAGVGSLLAVLAGCAAPPETEGLDGSGSAITTLKESAVKRQDIETCWLYASAGWAESLVLLSGDPAVLVEAPDYSEKYWAYWDWYDLITNASEWLSTLSFGYFGIELNAGGYRSRAMDLVRRRGLANEDGFRANASGPDALAFMNAALKERLGTAAKRADHALVRKVLDEAWHVSEASSQDLDEVFGHDGGRRLDTMNDADARELVAGTLVLRAEDIALSLPDGQGGVVASTLAEEAYGARAWSQAGGGLTESFSSRSVQVRAQRALADGYTLPLDWLVDDRTDTMFTTAFRQTRAGHASLLTDYEIVDVPGFGVLRLDVPERRPDALKAALDPGAHITRIRLKNSWGTDRVSGGVKGYTDLSDVYFADHGAFTPPALRPIEHVALPPGY